VHWPGSDAALLALIPVIALVCLGYTALLRGARTRAQAAPARTQEVAPVTVPRPAAPGPGLLGPEERH
jgi:hypothetical protein